MPAGAPRPEGRLRSASVRVDDGGRPQQSQSPSGIALDEPAISSLPTPTNAESWSSRPTSGVLYGMRVRAHRVTVLAGTTCGSHGSLGYPTGIAVDGRGDVFVAEATDQRVLELRPSGSHQPIDVCRHRRGRVRAIRRRGQGQRTQRTLRHRRRPVGDVFIADSGNCRIQMVPATSMMFDGQAMTAGDMYTVAGDGVCGSADRGGRCIRAHSCGIRSRWLLMAPGDLFIADSGDQSVLEVPTHSGTYYGTPIGAETCRPSSAWACTGHI